MSFTFTPNPAGLAALLESPSGDVGQWTGRQVAKVVAMAKQRAPRVTGKLRDSIRGDLDGFPVRGVVIADAPYAMAVHEGTRPHEIVPSRARVLRFPANGGVVFAPRVEHPGTKGQPFLLEALRAVIPGA